MPVVDADRALALEPHAGDEGEGLDAQVGARPGRVEVGPGGRPAAAPVDVAVEPGEALLPVAVDVVGQREARLLGGLEEHPEERVGGRTALQQQRAVVAAPGVPGRPAGVVEAGLHPLEVRQAVQVVPRLEAGVGRPALEVHRVAALEDHPVDRAAAAEDLAARVVDPPVVHVRLGIGLVLPVVEPVADRERQRRGHVHQRVEAGVRVPRLEDEHRRARVRAQPVGQRTARRATADDDVVVALPLPAHRASLFSVVEQRSALGGRAASAVSRPHVPSPNHCWGSGLVLRQMCLVSWYSSSPARPSSRPIPDCL